MAKYQVIVHPKSKKPRVEKNSDGKVHVYVKQAPEKGKANEAVINFLAKYFQVSRSRVIILSGLRSRKKLVEILV